MKTLLHTCCGPCASACVPRLKEMGREVTLLFANSNIDTREEFEKRFHEAEKLANADGVEIVALPYDHEDWLREVAVGYENEPERGARCTRCFRYNLAKAAAFAAEHGYDEFTTSLTVSPHKDSKTIFSIASSLSNEAVAKPCPSGEARTPPLRRCISAERSELREAKWLQRCVSPHPHGGFVTTSNLSNFLQVDFKKREGFKLSTRRAAELGLYRQSYCGCEFSKWRLHHKKETASTNLDARVGRHGDVFTADFQTAGRGRLDHKWLSPPGTNLMMSVVLSVADLPPEHVVTLPLAIGLAVAKAVEEMSSSWSSSSSWSWSSSSPVIKWPNDVLVGGRKLAGILCERNGDAVIVGIGVNVNQTEFPPEIAGTATSLALLGGMCEPSLVLWKILKSVEAVYGAWKTGFGAVYPEIAKIDCLKGRRLSVRQTDDDSEPIVGVSGGIRPDGTLDVGGTPVYAGEAHVAQLLHRS